MGQHTQTIASVTAAAREIDLSHQEVQRMVEEVDNIYEMSQQEWLAAEPVSMFLCTQLGYEDVDELEDALHGTFAEFLAILPDVETKMDVAPSAAAAATPSDEATTPSAPEPQLYFKVLGAPGPEHWVPTKLTYRVTQRAQLWNVLLKSPHARIEIPALGFEVSADGRKKIDTVWNYLSQAALDLGMHVQNNKGFSDSDTDKTVDVIEGLAALRDVDYEWDMVVIDPTGISRFTDESLVVRVAPYEDEGRMVDLE
ncbi:hypothetical protein BC828DRAFT_388480 [Blastocladiella britannica]|nr:hypothetical protein BC828DRAFT_388480 [Blastocladiella britannica]